MNRIRSLRKSVLACALFWVGVVGSAEAANISLGTFNFDSNLFGDTLTESDGGSFSAANWLNVVNADPGNPAYLTGANFNTGIANLGLGAAPVYTIGYNTAIVNGAGDDLGLVEATYSSSDTYRIAVSTDGVTFGPALSFSEALSTNTGVACNYFYGGGGPYGCTLGVISLDLSAFGIGNGVGISAVQISGSPEADLIRVAGYSRSTSVPEPSVIGLMVLGLMGLRLTRRRG